MSAAIEINKNILLTTTYKIEADPCQDDFRSRIHPKISFRHNNIYDPLPYSQNFGTILSLM
jgi:hypothetical protein